VFGSLGGEAHDFTDFGKGDFLVCHVSGRCELPLAIMAFSRFVSMDQKWVAILVFSFRGAHYRRLHEGGGRCGRLQSVSSMADFGNAGIATPPSQRVCPARH